jgi:hypothetical protein
MEHYPPNEVSIFIRPLQTSDVIASAGAVGIAIDGTIDTEVECRGVHDNAADLVAAGAKLFYATDMGHPDIPHGIDAQEIHMGIHAGLDKGKPYIDSLIQALASATSLAGDKSVRPYRARCVG